MVSSLPNILPINVVGTISGTAASGTPTSIFSLANIQNVVIINEDPLEVNLVGGVPGDVDDVNSVTGSVVIAGAGEVNVTTVGQAITVSGTPHADASVTLQEAYDNGDGIITTASGKSFELQGTGELTAVTGTFTEGLTIGTSSVVITPLAIGIGRPIPSQCVDVVGSGIFTGDVGAQGRIGAGTLSPTTELEVVGDITSRGTKWVTRTSAADIAWRGVVYGNGLFVAVSSVGASNALMYSPDGINWTLGNAPSGQWTAVTYGNGLFVAVSNDFPTNNVITSSDGINWTSSTSASNNQWASVTYGNGIFVAVSNDGTNRVMTSLDGLAWIPRAAAVDNGWRGVIYGNSLFVAVAETGTDNRVMTSPDGINWTTQTNPVNNDWLGVTYGNGLFVAVASGAGTGNRVMTSPDGINWTSQTSAEDNGWISVTYGNGLFVAVAFTGDSNRVMTSPDGIDWTIRTSSVDNQWFAVTYGNGVFVAVSFTGSGDRVMTSGKTEFNEVPTKNILQGGREIRGHLNVGSHVTIDGDITVSGTTVNLVNLPTASGALTAGDLWVDVADNYALRMTP